MPSSGHTKVMRPVKICFVMGVGERYRVMYRVAEKMADRFKLEVSYLVVNEEMIEYLLEKKVDRARINFLNEKYRFGSWGSDPVDHEFLKEMEKKYGIPNLYLYWEAVRNYRGYDHCNAMKMLETVFRVFETFLEKQRFDFALMDAFPASLPMLVMSAIMERKNTPFYFLIPSRIEKRFLMVRGIDDKYDRIDGIFDSLKDRDLTEEERKEAEEFVARYDRGKRYFSTSERAVFLKKDVSWARLRRGTRAILNSFRYGTARMSFRKHSFWSPFHYAAQRVKTIIKKQFLAGNKLFQKPVEGDRYVLFLLSKQPEASTYVKSPFFMDQRYLIEVIAKSLPIGYSVYVKPHHNDFGNLPLKYYRDLISRPNVRMLKISLNSQELVRNCSAVITISGTVGWEGIILGKPVITFGRVFYNYFDQVMHVDNITDLPLFLREAIFNYRPDRELTLKYVSAHIQGTHEGVPLSPIYTNNSSLSPDNIEQIVNGISLELGLEHT
ncbi:MAG: hypothetical protein JW882_03215 [Deltaproteobacteria bacterium]|nr:hypothetical protein [Deltaproteobacteria bacterium]